MAGDLQSLVDDLASRLRRPLLLEDRLQRVVAYSEQDGPIDDIRRDSILRRHTAPEVREWLRGAGIHESAGPLRTPAAPGLGLLPRVCLPARHGGRLLGFLWFIDAGPCMTDTEVELAARATPAVALALFRESMASGLASRRELEAVTELLAGAAGAAART
ncbi:CdaR family transcriptional regulator, partial [Spongiactinospora gelatinilytica]